VKATKDIASIYNLYVGELFTYGLYLSFEREIVMDAIQDVFYKLAADEKILNDVLNIKFYLFKSLKNRLYDLRRLKKEHVALENIDSAQEMPFHIHVNVEDLLIEEEEQVQIRTEIEQMLNSLTHRQREVIYLRYVQEYDYSQIAELLHISVHGCRKLVSKAITTLREKYGATALLLLLLS
jgi:RNA polymerase sigma factor, sigma-70 family